MAQQTIAFLDSDLVSISGIKVWNLPSNTHVDRSLVSSSLTDDQNLIIDNVNFNRNTGSINITFRASAGSVAYLSDKFNQGGGIDVTVNGITYSFDVRNLEGPLIYRWTPVNSEDVKLLVNSNPNRIGGTLVLRDTGLTRKAAINVPIGESGTTQSLSVQISGSYDSITYLWKVSGGTLDSASSATPTWTRPSNEGIVDISARVTVRVTFTYSGGKTVYTAAFNTFVTPQIIANESLDLSTGNFIRWSATTKSLSFVLYPEMIGSFVPSGTRRFLTNLSVTSTRFDIGFGPTIRSTARADLTPLFERAGAIKLTVGSTEYIIPMDSQDSSDNYRLTRPRSVISAFASAWDGTGTLEFIYPISMYHSGVLYHEVFLGSTRYKKIYLGSEEYI